MSQLQHLLKIGKNVKKNQHMASAAYSHHFTGQCFLPGGPQRGGLLYFSYFDKNYSRIQISLHF